MGDFYGTGIEIWAGFGPVSNTEKKNWVGYVFFHVFKVKKNEAFALKSCIKRS